MDFRSEAPPAAGPAVKASATTHMAEAGIRTDVSKNNGINEPTKRSEGWNSSLEEPSLDDLMAALEGKLREMSLAERMHADWAAEHAHNERRETLN